MILSIGLTEERKQAPLWVVVVVVIVVMVVAMLMVAVCVAWMWVWGYGMCWFSSLVVNMSNGCNNGCTKNERSSSVLFWLGN